MGSKVTKTNQNDEIEKLIVEQNINKITFLRKLKALEQELEKLKRQSNNCHHTKPSIDKKNETTESNDESFIFPDYFPNKLSSKNKFTCRK